MSLLWRKEINHLKIVLFLPPSYRYSGNIDCVPNSSFVGSSWKKSNQILFSTISLTSQMRSFQTMTKLMIVLLVPVYISLSPTSLNLSNRDMTLSALALYDVRSSKSLDVGSGVGLSAGCLGFDLKGDSYNIWKLYFLLQKWAATAQNLDKSNIVETWFIILSKNLGNMEYISPLSLAFGNYPSLKVMSYRIFVIHDGIPHGPIFNNVYVISCFHVSRTSGEGCL